MKKEDKKKQEQEQVEEMEEEVKPKKVRTFGDPIVQFH